MSIRAILTEDRRLITYRPTLRPLIGSVNGVILFQQLLHWYGVKQEKFFKFLSPCNHAWYKEGDSLEEETGMSAKEIRTALDQFAFKCGEKNKALHGSDYEKIRDKSMITYYTDAYRVTWYMINEQEVESRLAFTYNIPMGVYKVGHSVEFTNTETTPETTTNTNTYTSPDGQEAKSNVVKAEVGLDGDSPDDNALSFEAAWCVYGKYGTKAKALNYWKRLSGKQRQAIIEAIPQYLRVVDAGRRKKCFEGWINPANKEWEQDWTLALREWGRTANTARTQTVSKEKLTTMWG